MPTLKVSKAKKTAKRKPKKAPTKIIPIEPVEDLTNTVVKGINEEGKQSYYKITDYENGMVKRIGAYSKDEFIRNLDVPPLSKEYCNQNTLVLYSYLKAHGFDVTKKVIGGIDFLDVNNFRIRYASHGFKIADLLNFSKSVNANNYYNDYDTPEKVADYVLENDERIELPDLDLSEVLVLQKGVSGKDMNDWDDVAQAAMEQLGGKWSVTMDNRAESPETLEEIAAHAKTEIARYAKKQLNKAELKTSIYKHISSMSIKTRVGERLNKLNRKNWKPTSKEVVEEILKGIAKKTAPKFVGFTDIHTDDVLRITHHKHTNMVEYWFPENGYERRREYTYSQFLWRHALMHYPKAMPLLMEIARGHFVKYDYDEMMDRKFDIKNAYIEYKRNILDKPVNKRQEALMEYVCLDILDFVQQTTPLAYIYDCKLLVGTKVKVYSAEEMASYVGTVASTKFALEIAYEVDKGEPEVEKPFKGQTIRPYDFHYQEELK